MTTLLPGRPTPPRSEGELMARAKTLAGLTLGEIAARTRMADPRQLPLPARGGPDSS